MLKIETHFYDPIVMVKIGATADLTTGEAFCELDALSSDALSISIFEQIHLGRLQIIIDFSQVTFIDSVSISVIFQIYNELKKRQGTLRILNPLVNVKFSLEMCMLHKLAQIVYSDNHNDAIKDFIQSHNKSVGK